MKTGSWNTDETASVVTAYDGGNGDSVETIAEATGRSKRSVQGKLTSAGVYVKPEKVVAVKKNDGPTKGEHLTAIKASGRFVDVDGLNGATKAALIEIRALVEKVAA